MMMVKKIALGTILAGLVFSGVAQAKDNYKFGVFPYLPPTKLQQLFQPISQNFSDSLGSPVQISSKSSYKAFREGLAAEQYDVAFVQPFDYVLAHDKHNYVPLARRGKDLGAIIIVRKDSPIQSFAELKGKKIANPPTVAAVSQLTSMALIDAGIDPDTGVVREYSKSHFSCMQKVLIGSADACGTARQALSHFEDKQMTQRFRILHETPKVPHSLFVVHKRVAEADRDKLRQHILDWPNNEQGKVILENGRFIPFVRAADAEYNAIREFWSKVK